MFLCEPTAFISVISSKKSFTCSGVALSERFKQDDLDIIQLNYTTSCVKMQLTPKFLRLSKFLCFSDHHCVKIIVVAIFNEFSKSINALFQGHDRGTAKNGTSYPATSWKG